ncbi:uncharacterized protein TNCV_572041 [Trichonephila clavipes]|nr:uncharacterized protein TNCV_572041 [Trichonephila clavipes]
MFASCMCNAVPTGSLCVSVCVCVDVNKKECRFPLVPLRYYPTRPRSTFSAPKSVLLLHSIHYLYVAKKRASWHKISSKIDARTNNSKSWTIAKSQSRDRSQVEVCNPILTADGFPPNGDRATANIIGSHYQKMNTPTFNKADKYTERQAKLAIHKCRSSDLGNSIFFTDFSIHEILLALNALNPKKSPGSVRPILEFYSEIFCSASDSNLKALERIQLSAARIIAGHRSSCPNNLDLYECDLQLLDMRRNYCLTKYFNKLLSYGDQHRTS